MQRIPHSSTRPSSSDAPRWQQCSASAPRAPLVSRNTTRRSPQTSTGKGTLSGSGRSDESITGSQYWRNALPIGATGPTRQVSSFSSLLSMTPLHQHPESPYNSFYQREERGVGKK